MKNTIYLQKLLVFGLSVIVLTFSMLLVVAPVHAEPLDDFINFLQDVEGEIGTLTQYGFPVSAQELAGSKVTLQCLIDANGDSYDTGICLQATDELPDEIDMFIDCYFYWMEGDYLGLAYHVGGDFVCAFLDYFLSGGYVDVCGLLEELAEIAEAMYDAGKAILEFFGDLAAGAYEALKAGACAVTGGLLGCDDDAPPMPPDAYLFTLLHPHLDDGVEKREAVDPAAFDNYLNALKNKILAEVNAQISTINKDNSLSLPFYTPEEMNRAAATYINAVNVGWTEDIINRENKNRKRAVDFYVFVIPSFVQQVADNCANKTTCEAEYTFTAMCSDNINMQQKFAHIDRWKNTPIIMDDKNIKPLQQQYEATSQVCQSFFQGHQEVYQEKARDYLIQQKICSESGPSLFCQDLEKYYTCNSLMTAFGQQNACSVNLQTAADEARAKIMARFRKEGSRFYPLTAQLQTSDTPITKKSRRAASIFAPDEFPCYRPTHEYFFKQFYKDLFTDLPSDVLRAVSKEDAAYTQLRDKVKNTVAKLKGNQEYSKCSFEISPIDPLLVEASSTYCLDQVRDNNDAPGLEFSSTVPKPLLTIDGRDTPLMFSDRAGEMEKQFKMTRLPELVNQKTDVTAPMDRNPVNQLRLKDKTLSAGKLNTAAEFAPATRLTGAGTSAVRPGQAMQTPAVGKQVMSGNALPGQQVGGKSLSSAILAKKSSSVLKKQGRGMQKGAAMEVLPISRRNTTSKPVTIKVKNVPFSRIPFELRYRPGTGGFYKPVQRPTHRFSRANNLTTLTLSLKQAGQYQVRFRSSGKGPWDKWHNFTVTENLTRIAGQAGKNRLQPTGPRAINPQPEPPGKAKRTATVRTGQTKHDKPVPAVSSKPIRMTRNIHLVPVTIQTPRNGQKFLLTGNSVTIKVKVGNRGGQKLQIEIQQKQKGRYATIRPVARQQQGHDLTTLNVVVKSGGEYRLRAKQTGKGAKWSGWRMFTVNTVPRGPVRLNRSPSTTRPKTPVRKNPSTLKPSLQPVK